MFYFTEKKHFNLFYSLLENFKNENKGKIEVEFLKRKVALIKYFYFIFYIILTIYIL